MLSSSRRTPSRFPAVMPWLLFTGGVILFGVILFGRVLPALF
ncbi:MAG: hypothetical protein VCE12_08725 [Candidatus Latescibacterota bacterium]